MQTHDTAPAPIPCRMGRYVMRSILEARWATCLSALDIPWLYEPKLWSLPSGRYLPDLWLPEHGCWVEIKPDGIPIADARYRDLAAAGETLVLLTGSPWPGDYSATLYTAAGVEENLRLALGRCNHEELWLARVQDGFSYPLSREVDGDRFPLFDCHALQQAYRAARNAIFEAVEERR